MSSTKFRGGLAGLAEEKVEARMERDGTDGKYIKNITIII